MQILLSFPFKPNGLSFFFLTETAKWTIWICKNLNSVHEGSSSAEPACYANVAAYRLVGSLVASPSWPTSIIHSCRSLSSPSSSSLHPFLHPHPDLICRQTLRCWGWDNGEVGCELAAEWQASSAPRNLREEHGKKSDKRGAQTRR